MAIAPLEFLSRKTTFASCAKNIAGHAPVSLFQMQGGQPGFFRLAEDRPTEAILE